MEPSKNKGNPWSYQVDASAASNQAPRQDPAPKKSDLHHTLPRLTEGERLHGLLQTIVMCRDVRSSNFEQLLHNPFVPAEAKQRWEHYATKAIEGVRHAEMKLSEFSPTKKNAHVTGIIVGELNNYFDAEDRRIMMGTTPDGHVSLSLAKVIDRFVLTDGVQHSPIYQVDGYGVGESRGDAIYDTVTKSALVAPASLAEQAKGRSASEVDFQTTPQQFILQIMLEEGCHGLDYRRVESACGYPFHRSYSDIYAETRKHLFKSDALKETLFVDVATLSLPQTAVLGHAMFELSANLFIGSYGRPYPILNHWKKRLELSQANWATKGGIDFQSKESCNELATIIGTHECGKAAGLTSATTLDFRNLTTIAKLTHVARELLNYVAKDPAGMSAIFEAVRLSHFNAPPRSQYRFQRISTVDMTK